MKKMTMLLIGVTTALTVTQASLGQAQPLAVPFGVGGQSADSPKQARPEPVDPFNNPFAGPRPPMIPNIDVQETDLETLLEYVKSALREQGEAVPNFVYREGAEKQVISSLRLRNVSLKGLLQVLEAVLDMDINTVENPGGEDIIVLRSPDVGTVDEPIRAGRVQNAPRVSLAGLPGKPLPAPALGKRHPENAPLTRVFATSDLGVDEDALMSTIRAVWDTSDPEWAKGEQAAKLLYHPQTRMLVVKASPDRLGDVEQLMEQLGHAKARAQQGEAAEMRRRLQDVERSSQRNLHQMKEAHERTIADMKDDRSRLLMKISELEMELRKAQVQRVRIQEAEKPREGGH